MPTFTYRCLSCAAQGTAFRSIAERLNCPTCTQCGSSTEKLIDAGVGVAVFKPYKTVAHDKETGKTLRIRTQADHRAFLARNGYEEVGNDKSMAPLAPDEIEQRRAEQLKAQEAPVFDFDETTHQAAL